MNPLNLDPVDYAKYVLAHVESSVRSLDDPNDVPDRFHAQTYAAWNCVQTKAALGEVLGAAPGYRGCWFASQVAKSLTAYKCGQQVAKLPPAARALWDGAAARRAERAFPGLNRTAAGPPARAAPPAKRVPAALGSARGKRRGRGPSK